VLESVFRVIAPLLPLAAEEMWRGLTGGRSVHLESWPEAEEFVADDRLVSDMDAIREAASVGLSLRKSSKLRVRLPLAKLTVAVADVQTLGAYADLLAEELNVKSVEVVEADSETASKFGLAKSLTVNARALGPRVGKDVQRIIGQAKSGNWQQTPDGVEVDGTKLEAGEYELTLVANADDSSQLVGLTSLGFVLLDTRLTPELLAEGLARDTIRHVQQARKDADLDVSDRISLALTADEESVTALIQHQELISKETLATELSIVAGAASSLQIGETGQLDISVVKN